MNAPIALPQLWQRLATERAELRGRVSREAPRGAPKERMNTAGLQNRREKQKRQKNGNGTVLPKGD